MPTKFKLHINENNVAMKTSKKQRIQKELTPRISKRCTPLYSIYIFDISSMIKGAKSLLFLEKFSRGWLNHFQEMDYLFYFHHLTGAYTASGWIIYEYMETWLYDMKPFSFFFFFLNLKVHLLEFYYEV